MEDDMVQTIEIIAGDDHHLGEINLKKFGGCKLYDYILKNTDCGMVTYPYHTRELQQRYKKYKVKDDHLYWRNRLVIKENESEYLLREIHEKSNHMAFSFLFPALERVICYDDEGQDDLKDDVQRIFDECASCPQTTEDALKGFRLYVTANQDRYFQVDFVFFDGTQSPSLHMNEEDIDIENDDEEEEEHGDSVNVYEEEVNDEDHEEHEEQGSSGNSTRFSGDFGGYPVAYYQEMFAFKSSGKYPANLRMAISSWNQQSKNFVLIDGILHQNTPKGCLIVIKKGEAEKLCREIHAKTHAKPTVMLKEICKIATYGHVWRFGVMKKDLDRVYAECRQCQQSPNRNNKNFWLNLTLDDHRNYKVDVKFTDQSEDDGMNDEMEVPSKFGGFPPSYYYQIIENKRTGKLPSNPKAGALRMSDFKWREGILWKYQSGNNLIVLIRGEPGELIRHIHEKAGHACPELIVSKLRNLVTYCHSWRFGVLLNDVRTVCFECPDCQLTPGFSGQDFSLRISVDEDRQINVNIGNVNEEHEEPHVVEREMSDDEEAEAEVVVPRKRSKRNATSYEDFDETVMSIPREYGGKRAKSSRITAGEYNDIYMYLKTHTLPKSLGVPKQVFLYRCSKIAFEESDNRVLRWKKAGGNPLVVCQEEIGHVLEEIHHKMGHMGAQKKCKVMKNVVHWKSMFDDLRQAQKSCKVCNARSQFAAKQGETTFVQAPNFQVRSFASSVSYDSDGRRRIHIDWGTVDEEEMLTYIRYTEEIFANSENGQQEPPKVTIKLRNTHKANPALKWRMSSEVPLEEEDGPSSSKISRISLPSPIENHKQIGAKPKDVSFADYWDIVRYHQRGIIPDGVPVPLFVKRCSRYVLDAQDSRLLYRKTEFGNLVVICKEEIDDVMRQVHEKLGHIGFIPKSDVILRSMFFSQVRMVARLAQKSCDYCKRRQHVKCNRTAPLVNDSTLEVTISFFDEQSRIVEIGWGTVDSAAMNAFTEYAERRIDGVNENLLGDERQFERDGEDGEDENREDHYDSEEPYEHDPEDAIEDEHGDFYYEPQPLFMNAIVKEEKLPQFLSNYESSSNNYDEPHDESSSGVSMEHNTPVYDYIVPCEEGPSCSTAPPSQPPVHTFTAKSEPMIRNGTRETTPSTVSTSTQSILEMFKCKQCKESHSEVVVCSICKTVACCIGCAMRMFDEKKKNPEDSSTFGIDTLVRCPLNRGAHFWEGKGHFAIGMSSLYLPRNIL